MKKFKKSYEIHLWKHLISSVLDCSINTIDVIIRLDYEFSGVISDVEEMKLRRCPRLSDFFNAALPRAVHRVRDIMTDEDAKNFKTIKFVTNRAGNLEYNIIDDEILPAALQVFMLGWLSCEITEKQFRKHYKKIRPDHKDDPELREDVRKDRKPLRLYRRITKLF